MLRSRIFLVVSLLMWGRAHVGADSQSPSFPATVDVVRIEAVVVDGRGVAVSGLSADDFELQEGDAHLPIATFEAVVVRQGPVSPSAVSMPVSLPIRQDPQEGRTLLVFFDDVHVGAESSERVRQQLTRFLQAELRDGDQVTIRAPLRGIEWTARTSFEKSALPKVIAELQGHFVRDPFHDEQSDFDVMNIVEYGRSSRDPATNMRQRADAGTVGGGGIGVGDTYVYDRYAVTRRRIRRTMTALQESIASLAGLPGRKSLVLYSEGFIRAPGMDDYEKVVDLARRSRVTLYFVDPRGIRSGLAGADGGRNERDPLTEMQTEGGGAHFLAASTGGRASLSNDLTALSKEVLTEAECYYVIGFAPPAGRDGERRIRVGTRRDGLTVRAPDRYYLGLKTPSVKPVDGALASVADALDLPVRVAALRVKPPHPKGTPVALAIQVGRPTSEEIARDLALDVAIEVRPLVGREVVRAQTRVALSANRATKVIAPEVKLGSGLWQARIVVRDPKTNAMGSVLHSFAVPEAGALSISSPLLSRSGFDDISLDRDFLVGDVLHCSFEIFGSSGSVSSGHVVWGSGATVRESRAKVIQPTGGVLRQKVAVDLRDFTPGTYALELRVHDQVSGRDVSLREPFTVAEPPTAQ